MNKSKIKTYQLLKKIRSLYLANLLASLLFLFSSLLSLFTTPPSPTGPDQQNRVRTLND